MVVGDGHVRVGRRHIQVAAQHGVIGDAQSSWTPEEYMEENIRHWDDLNTQLLMFSPRESNDKHFSYPFADALKVPNPLGGALPMPRRVSHGFGSPSNGTQHHFSELS